MSLITPVIIDVSQEFSDEHGKPTCRRLMLKFVQVAEDLMKLFALGKFQGLTNQLINHFSNLWMPNSRFPMSSSRLELADQMKVTQLKNPAILSGQLFGAAKIVAHDGADAFPDVGRNRFDESHPTFQTFGAWKKQGIQKNGVMTLDWFESSQSKNPGLIPEREPCSIEQENKRTTRKFLSILSLNEFSQNFSKPMTQALRRKITSPTQIGERSLLPKDAVEHNETHPPRRSATLLDSNSPGSSTFCALSASWAKKINLCTTTCGYSGHIFHANRVATFRGSVKKLLTVDIS